MMESLTGRWSPSTLRTPYLPNLTTLRMSRPFALEPSAVRLRLLFFQTISPSSINGPMIHMSIWNFFTTAEIFTTVFVPPLFHFRHQRVVQMVQDPWWQAIERIRFRWEVLEQESRRGGDWRDSRVLHEPKERKDREGKAVACIDVLWFLNLLIATLSSPINNQILSWGKGRLFSLSVKIWQSFSHN